VACGQTTRRTSTWRAEALQHPDATECKINTWMPESIISLVTQCATVARGPGKRGQTHQYQQECSSVREQVIDATHKTTAPQDIKSTILSCSNSPPGPDRAPPPTQRLAGIRFFQINWEQTVVPIKITFDITCLTVVFHISNTRASRCNATILQRVTCCNARVDFNRDELVSPRRSASIQTKGNCYGTDQPKLTASH